MSTETNRILLIDANNVFYRALFAFLSTKNYNSIQRFFLEELWNLRTKFTGYVPVYVWDGGKKRRQSITSEAIKEGLIKVGYKGGRKEIMPMEDMLVLLQSAKECLKACWCQQVQVQGEEADDLIYSYTLDKSFEKIIIVSNDADFTQCLEKGRVVIYNHYTGEFKNSEVLDGLTVEQWIQASALFGDAGDSIPGISGWGKKTVYNAVRVAGSVDELKRSIEENGAKKKREANLLVEWPLYELSLKLKRSIKIDNLPPIKAPIMKDEEALKKFFIKIGKIEWVGRAGKLTKGD
jgi:protein Xni